MTNPENSAPAGAMTEAALPPAKIFSLQSLQDRLALYLKHMAPGVPVDANKGAEHQQALWSTIKYVLSKKESEFVALYAELLKTAAEHRNGAFGPKYLYRFFDIIQLSSTERRNFERMLNLIYATAVPSTRQMTLRQIDFHTTFKGFPDPQIQEKIAGFYSV